MPVSERKGAVTPPRPFWKNRWLYIALLVVTSPLWLWWGFWTGVMLFFPVQAVVENHGDVAIESGQYTAFERSHAFGRIEPGKSRTIVVWAPSDRSNTRLSVRLASGKTTVATSFLYAPWGARERWTIKRNEVVPAVQDR